MPPWSLPQCGSYGPHKDVQEEEGGLDIRGTQTWILREVCNSPTAREALERHPVLLGETVGLKLGITRHEFFLILASRLSSADQSLIISVEGR